jgi:trk system potassium uptake protein TrkH
VIGWLTILRLLGFFVLGIGVSLIIPLGFALWEADEGVLPLFLALAAGLSAGAAGAFLLHPEPHEINRREGVLFVVLAWVAAVSLGALPYFLSPYFPSFTDSFFESISGFTTTGATILADIEGLPRSLLLWRALTHWLGGMGIIVLGIAILPLLGTGGMELYRAEFSGAHSEKVKPRIAETALALWKIYVAFTLVEYVALRMAGMTSFDAVCHAFATMATGGFSTKATSIESFNSPTIEYVITIFMIIAGINFTQHYRLLVERKPRSFLRDPEIRHYVGAIVLAVIAVSAVLMIHSATSLADSVRLSLFQVASIITTTGFTSADFELWAPFAQFVLLVLMFIGGCTGSTAGGMKTARIVMLLRVVGREFKRMVERRGVFAVRFGGQAVSENTIASVLNLVYLAFIINFVACLVLTASGVDLMTAFSAVAASMFNIGPGLGSVGPAENYAHLPSIVKWVLSFCMLAGRLEFYTVLVIFTPMFWRK